ncbi:hypothetical protein QLH51_12425 [Sphingomonas sp. 2R-10]|uniref:hypothetical protein n=1 Tax=Sphingomonas sp. 2R-10 TaxID=3045148 RepID=UPI000F7A8652|nr:hypothetical protein [Sphingomonas sp. 2R-10]MDJ0277601.1 hypothetical protein [Sphingomonas sp. 2R-10]
MTDPLDRSLRLLSRTPDHPGLHGVESGVFDRLHGERAARGAGLRLAGIAAIGAVTLGLIAADPLPRPVPPALADDLALAPSTLLGDR